MAAIAGLVIVSLMIAGAAAPTTGWLWGLLAIFAVQLVCGRAEKR